MKNEIENVKDVGYVDQDIYIHSYDLQEDSGIFRDAWIFRHHHDAYVSPSYTQEHHRHQL